MKTPDTSGLRETTHRRLAAADPAGDATVESPIDARLFIETPNRLIHSVTTWNLTNFFCAIGNRQRPAGLIHLPTPIHNWSNAPSDARLGQTARRNVAVLLGITAIAFRSVDFHATFRRDAA